MCWLNVDLEAGVINEGGGIGYLVGRELNPLVDAPVSQQSRLIQLGDQVRRYASDLQAGDLLLQVRPLRSLIGAELLHCGPYITAVASKATYTLHFPVHQPEGLPFCWEVAVAP
ncbi:hypothetical protein [Streptomyces sp. NPDC058295]|uniref:hypothetical protein n=1 Tax=Streptomyces sp. NPDC058295 TaxID=3346431 RepID=UPI0036EFC1E5